MDSVQGILLKVMSALSADVENIIEAHACDENDNGSMWFRLAVKNQGQFSALMRAVKELHEVKVAERFFPDKN